MLRWFRAIDSHYKIIILAALLVHGLILLNDGVYWDGWPVYLSEDSSFQIYADQSNHVHGYIQQVMKWLPLGVFPYKILNFTSITLAAIFIYQIGLASGFVSRQDSLFIALLSLTYPAFQVAFEIILGPFVFFYMIFLLGIWLLFRMESIPHRLAALFFIFWGFWLNSALIFYGGFLLLLFARNWLSGGLRLPRALLSFVRSHIDFIGLPLLFWIVKLIVFPAVEGSRYNQIEVAPTIFYNYMEFIRVGIAQLNEVFGTFTSLPLYLLLIALLVRIAYPYLLSEEEDAPSRTVAPGYVLGFGVFLLILGITPYVAVEKIPTPHGWQTRFMILTGLPMAVILVAGTRLLFGDANVRGFRLRHILLLMFIVMFGSALVESYVGWQARWIKDRSMIAALRDIRDVEDITIFWVDDTFIMGGEPRYFQHEWDAIFEYTWQDDTPQTGFPVTMIPLIHRIERLQGEQGSGCQAVLSIRRGPQPLNFNKELGLSFRYFVFKYSPAGSVNRYLQDLTDVRIRRILAPQATNCERQNVYLAQSEGEQLFLDDARWEVQKFRTDLMAFLERSAQSTVPEQPQDFSYYVRGGYPHPQPGALRYFVSQGFASAQGDPPEACVSQHNLDLLDELGFDLDYFKTYCMIGSQPDIAALIPQR